MVRWKNKRKKNAVCVCVCVCVCERERERERESEREKEKGPSCGGDEKIRKQLGYYYEEEKEYLKMKDISAKYSLL